MSKYANLIEELNGKLDSVNAKLFQVAEAKHDMRLALGHQGLDLLPYDDLRHYASKVHNLGFYGTPYRIRAQTDEPTNPKQGDIWVKTETPIKIDRVFMGFDYEDGDMALYKPNSLAFTENGTEKQKVMIFNNHYLFFIKDIAYGFYVNKDGMQEFLDIFLYDAERKQFITIPTTQLPIILVEKLKIKRFFDANCNIPSFKLKLNEEVVVMQDFAPTTQTIDIKTIFSQQFVVPALPQLVEAVAMYKGDNQQIYP